MAVHIVRAPVLFYLVHAFAAGRNDDDRQPLVREAAAEEAAHRPAGRLPAGAQAEGR